jgi:hypothetical protein
MFGRSFGDEGSVVSTSSARADFGSSRDDKYWERRRKNNEAAKKSRDARRVRENQLRLKVLCLENANQVTPLSPGAQGCQIFFYTQYTKTGKIYTK